MKIYYKVTDTTRGIEESDELGRSDLDNADFSSVVYDQLEEAFCSGTDWALEGNRPWRTHPYTDNSLTFWASDENGETTFEW
jgi:hypothetical protein